MNKRHDTRRLTLDASKNPDAEKEIESTIGAQGWNKIGALLADFSRHTVRCYRL
jgi:hypothetical protein